MIPLHDDNPTILKPFVTVTVIVLCSLIFFWQLSLGSEGFQQAVLTLGVIPANLFASAPLAIEQQIIPPMATIFSSMFLHGGWMHLIGNMLYLWIFGNNVEDTMGHVRFIFFYLICGVAAALAQALPDMSSQVPMIGASGAISGVLGAYLLLYPHARILVLIPLGFVMQMIRLPAGWVLVFWFVWQIISSLLTTNAQGGVAWGAHIGGFIAGMVLIPLFKMRRHRLFAPQRGDRR
jgi:membrane associated rhomboid family serine protease